MCSLLKVALIAPIKEIIKQFVVVFFFTQKNRPNNFDIEAANDLAIPVMTAIEDFAICNFCVFAVGEKLVIGPIARHKRRVQTLSGKMFAKE